MNEGRSKRVGVQDLIPDITLKRTLSNSRRIGGRSKRRGGVQDLIPDITLKEHYQTIG